MTYDELKKAQRNLKEASMYITEFVRMLKYVRSNSQDDIEWEKEDTKNQIAQCCSSTFKITEGQ